MTRATFFKHFELLADQTDAVAKMRELVLQLAIQGKLVACDPKDTTAHKLAARVRAAKERDFEPISKQEVPFVLPASWEWLRIGEAMNLINGRAFKPTDWSREGLPIIRIQNLNKPDAPFNHCNFEVDEKVIVRTGDFLISWSGTPGTSFGAFIWNRGKAVLNQHIFRAELLGDAYTKEFLRLAVNGRLEEMIAKAHGAVGLQHITKGKLEMLVLPLPPLAEQRRIVAKVDELMALCDELEQRQQARQHARGQLQQSALHHLLAAREPHTFAAAWQRVRDHFHLLHDTPDALPQLRQAILQLAVQGRLVPQNPKDEPVSEQLREIEKARLLFVQKGLMRKSDSLPDVEADEMPYQIPSNWKWVRVGTVGMTQTGSTPPTANRDFFGGFIPFVKPADLTEREINYGGEGISELGVKQSTLIPANSVLMVCIGGSIGKTNLNTRDVCCNQQINALTPFSKTESRYIMSCMKAAWFQQQVKRDAGQTTLPIISKGKWERLPFPLPSLAEQKRIVARVEELLRWCDTLEAQLRQTRILGAHLLDSTLHHLLAAGNQTTCSAPSGATYL